MLHLIKTMEGQNRSRLRIWMLPVGVVVLIAGHGILYYALSHTALSAAVVSGVIILAASISPWHITSDRCRRKVIMSYLRKVEMSY
jgi:hypothetical protein